MSSILRSKIEKTGLKLMAVILILSAIMTMVPVTARAAGDDWLVASASARQTVTIDNPTGTTLTDMPVLLRLASANIPEKGGVSFYQGETRLSAELANWNPSGKSEFWVKVPTLAANADTEITAYYSETTVAGVSASDVWSDDYALVQHFSQESVTAGKDSTGRNSLIQTGALAYKQTETGAAATFGGTQKLTYGNVAGGAERISISAVVDIPRVSTNWQGIICRYDNSKPAAERAFLFGLENTGKSYNRFYGSANPERILADTPVSPGIHLFTTTYNGTMARVYVDGNLKVSETLVNGTFYSGASSPLTIGAYSNSAVSYPFSGDIYDAFVKTTDISAEEEQFRYANYLGNIVTVLPEETKNGKISLRITNPRPGETLETGIHTVTGAISSAATLSYTLNGSAPVDVGSFAMGTFAFDAPFYALGENTLSVTAADTSDAQNTKTVSVSFTCADTAPPRQPALSSADDGGGSVTLNAQIEQESVETTAVTFYGLKTLPLTSQNTTVYSGATASETPFALTASGAEEASPFPPGVEKTTAGQNKTPYQIYEIALDEAARQINQFRVCWSGNTAGAPREVTMYVYNHAQNQWAKAGSGYSEDSFSIEATVENTAGLLNDGKLTLLVWRGMNEPIEGRRSYIPSNPGQYDFNLMWTTDTQFYAETPSYMFHLESQFNWIADHFKALKSRMLLNTGDIVNVYNDHAQWEAMSSVYEIIENAKIPHAMITGNHDVPDKTTTANNIYANYFPAERLMENNPYFSGHMGNENYYYLMEENGAKFLIMGIGLQIKQADVDWANGILAQYPDRFAILLYHDYLLANGNIDHAGQYADVAAFRKIVTANENVRLILCGHWAGAETNLEDIGGRPVYAILQDYQGLAQGGLGYFRMLKFDVENGLLYVNTYSETMGNNAYFTGVQGAKTGLYQLNKDEYALRLDFGAHQSRTLTTESLSVSNAGASSPIGAAQSVTGPGSASVIWNGLDGESNYAWHVVLRDEAGNETTSPVKTFFTESTEAPMSLPIEGNSIWKYNDTNTNLDTAWRAESFDDSAWKTGKGPLGYPASDSNSTFGPVSSGTLVNNLSNPNAYITYYFRKTFDIAAEDLAKITKLELTVGIDDGYVMYINGTEVRRLYMPDGELGWQTWATYVNEPSSQQGTDTADITAAALPLLKSGTNTIAVEVHNRDNTSSDIYFDMRLTASGSQTPQTATVKNTVLNIGTTEAQRNIVWYSDSAAAGEVQLALKSAMTDNTFPASYQTFAAVRTNSSVSGFGSYKAAVTDLAAGTEYVYRVGNSEGRSDIYSFKTGSFSGDFSFLAAGDPQIGSSGNAGNDTAGWTTTLNKAESWFPNARFLISLGDQVETNNNETEYNGFLTPDYLRSVTLATNIGNHDSSGASNGVNYKEHFGVPNSSPTLGLTGAGGDYWYSYNGVLFMSINTNNRSTAEHSAFLSGAVEEYKAQNDGADPLWKLVTFHHAIYSSASHTTDADIRERRTELSPVFAQLGIDAVLAGHDHVYTRSYMMGGQNGMTPVTEGYTADGNGQYAAYTKTNPNETLYITANSASGSKYYALKQTDFQFVAAQNQENTPNLTKVDVTADTLTFTTYRTGASNTAGDVVDTFTLSKAPAQTADKRALDSLVTAAASKAEAEYEAGSWTKFAAALSTARAVSQDDAATQEEVDTARMNLQAAMDDLAPVQAGTGGTGTAVNAPDDGTPPSSGHPFTDVNDSDWFHDDVLYVYSRGLMAGTAADEFSPQTATTRGMLVTILYRAAGQPDVSGFVNPFDDVTENRYYTDAVKWAAQNAIVNGYGNGKFGPNDNITREQLAAILYRYEQFSEKIPPDIAAAREFADWDSIDDYAKSAVNVLVAQGIVNGRPGKQFDPQGEAARAETAAMLHRFSAAIK